MYVKHSSFVEFTNLSNIDLAIFENIKHFEKVYFRNYLFQFLMKILNSWISLFVFFYILKYGLV